jgi:RimJ/RimL family protein N-acetyltransferase
MAEFLLETPRLRIERLDLDDADFILELLNDPAFIEHIGDKGLRTPEDAVGYLRNGPLASYAEHGFGLWRVGLTEDASPIGICGLIKRPALADVDLGYAFLPRYRGRGYALEAARAVMAFAREALDLARIVAIVTPENLRSQRLLETLEFAFERRLRMPGDETELKLYAWQAAEH